MFAPTAPPSYKRDFVTVLYLVRLPSRISLKRRTNVFGNLRRVYRRRAFESHLSAIPFKIRGSHDVDLWRLPGALGLWKINALCMVWRKNDNFSTLHALRTIRQHF